MNVHCTHCETLFRVDPRKVPRGGVQARCSVCSGVFFVPDTEVAVLPIPGISRPGPGVGAPKAAPGPDLSSRMPPPAAPSPLAPAFAAPAVGASFAPPASPSIPSPAAAPPPPPAVARPGSGQDVESQPALPGREAAPTAPRRTINPFLSQDPATKARRLARALISDLVVYHPAKRADGLRDGSLKILFEEEIRKCWEEYTEQVGDEMANSTGYFTEALNEILADGRPVFP